jgi:hypothetical protein
MAKRRKRKKKEEVRPWSMSNPDPNQRECVRCGSHWVPCPDHPGSGTECVWSQRQLKGPPCCEGATLPANHRHAGCTRCGATWIEDLDGAAKEIRDVVRGDSEQVGEVPRGEADNAED